MSQESLQDFLAVASELRVGGIAFDSREEKLEEKQDFRQKESVFATGQGVTNQTPIHQTESNWDQKLDYRDNLENMLQRQRSDNGHFGRNNQSQWYLGTLEKSNVRYGEGGMLGIEKEEVGEIAQTVIIEKEEIAKTVENKEIGEIARNMGKRKRQYDYLRDPIRVKANDRTGKVNINTLYFLT